MKKSISVIILICVLSLSLWGCVYDVSQDTNTPSLTLPETPPIEEETPEDEIGEVETPDVDNDAPSTDTDITNNPSDDVSLPVVSKKEYTYYIKSKANSLSIRSGAGTSYGMLGYLDKDDMTLYKGEKNGWYITVYKEKTAYISSTLSVVIKIEKASSQIENILEQGYPLLGYPYVWGATRYHWGNGVLNYSFEKGQFDCSSFTQYIFYKGGKILLDVNTRTQVLQGKTVSNLKRGDVMFFTNSSREHLSGVERVGHVAIYLGDNYIMHTASDYAVIEPISATRWSYYLLSKRFV